ncbi:hypothetical protein [Sorangium sp. So ce1000]|uniref:hypothetical protein n=1 Tax=Sorangium sp. So ce1000 TaxID=3133325 RepID=UPI003F5F4A58
MLLAVIDESTLLGTEDAKMAVRACASQLKLHVAPLWDMVPASIVYYEDKNLVPPGADFLIILDAPDQAGALGYHQVTPEGEAYARVFVRPIFNHDGTPLKGNMSVSSVMSHEVCEWFVDRYLNLWADGPEGQYPVEICDPVDNDSYEINGVAVSNFVTKRYFDMRAPATAQLDYLGKLTKPFTMTEGGFMQVRKAGVIERIHGARFPDWKLTETRGFPAARSTRREAQAPGR